MPSITQIINSHPAVLVVSSSAKIANALKGQLQSVGFGPVECESDAGVAAGRMQDADIVFVDGELPGAAAMLSSPRKDRSKMVFMGEAAGAEGFDLTTKRSLSMFTLRKVIADLYVGG